MTDTNAAIAVYDHHSEAEDAVRELQKSGFDTEAAKAREILSKLKPLHVADHVLDPTRQPATV